MTEFGLTEAAKLIGVSPDTVRRLVDKGTLAATRVGDGPRVVSGESLAAYLAAGGHAGLTRSASSARNRMVGLVTAVKKDRVMAQVEIQSGPHRVVSLMSREALDELGLDVGSVAAVVIKSTTVIVECPR